MKKLLYEQAKKKEAIKASIKEKLKLIEGGKILSLTIRTFSTDKQAYEDITIHAGTDLPREKIKGLLLSNLKGRLEKAEKDFEEFFTASLSIEDDPELLVEETEQVKTVVIPE